MKAAKFLTLILAIPLLVQQGPSGQPCQAAEPMGTAFTYQGFLKFEDTVITGTCTFEFKLWDDPVGGTQYGGTLSDAIDVTDGHFTALLDFGNVHDGDARFLEIAVDCTDPFDDLVTLSPRQETTPTPYAIYAQSSGGLNSSENLVLTSETGNLDIGDADTSQIVHLWGERHTYAPGATGTKGVYPTDFDGATYGEPSETEWDFGLQATPMMSVRHTSGPAGGNMALVAVGGTVVVGALNQATKLVVYDDISSSEKMIAGAFASNSPLIFEAPSGTPRMRIDDITGNVGIGTTSPQAMLHVYRPSGVTDAQIMVETDGVASAYAVLDRASLYRSAGVKCSTNGVTDWVMGTLYFVGASTSRFGISSTGDLGTGNEFVINTNGNVGLGTVSPGAKLEVNGQVKITGGSPGEDKVLTSDANGLASWQTLAKDAQIAALEARLAVLEGVVGALAQSKEGGAR